MAVSCGLSAAALSLNAAVFSRGFINKNIFIFLREHVEPTCVSVTLFGSLSHTLNA